VWALSGFLFGGDKGARPGGWGLAAMLRLLAVPKLVADSAVAPGIRIRAQGLAREVVHDLSYGTVTGFFAKARPQPPRMADAPPAAGPGVVDRRRGRLADRREAKRSLVWTNRIFAGGRNYPSAKAL